MSPVLKGLMGMSQGWGQSLLSDTYTDLTRHCNTHRDNVPSIPSATEAASPLPDTDGTPRNLRIQSPWNFEVIIVALQLEKQ